MGAEGVYFSVPETYLEDVPNGDTPTSRSKTMDTELSFTTELTSDGFVTVTFPADYEDSFEADSFRDRLDGLAPFTADVTNVETYDVAGVRFGVRVTLASLTGLGNLLADPEVQEMLVG